MDAPTIGFTVGAQVYGLVRPILARAVFLNHLSRLQRVSHGIQLLLYEGIKCR